MADLESKKLKDFEKRLVKLEKAVFGKKSKRLELKKENSGIKGGIQLLIKNSFFNKPKSVPEIVSELKREAYHYPTESVRTSLSRDFTKKERVLTRIQEKGNYKYVLRK